MLEHVRNDKARVNLPNRNSGKRNGNLIEGRVDIVGNGKGIVEGDVDEFERPCGADRKLRILKT